MLEKIKELLAEKFDIDASSITEETDFKKDLGADSLDLFEMITDLEDEYNITIPAEQLEKLVTVRDVIDYLKSVGIEG